MQERSKRLLVCGQKRERTAGRCEGEEERVKEHRIVGACRRAQSSNPAPSKLRRQATLQATAAFRYAKKLAVVGILDGAASFRRLSRGDRCLTGAYVPGSPNSALVEHVMYKS
jgi:hypothetical protein